MQIYRNISQTTGKSLKDAALRSLKRKADIGIRGGFQYYRVNKSYSGISNMVPSQIRTRGVANHYEPYNGVSLDKVSSIEKQQTELRDSNNRLKALQELDKRREAQLKKEFEALEIRRKQQENETKKRISLKQMRLTETEPLSNEQFTNYSKPVIKERRVRDMNQQQRYNIMVD